NTGTGEGGVMPRRASQRELRDWHEAAHAYLLYLFSWRVWFVDLARCRFSFPPGAGVRPWVIVEEIRILAAGSIAQEMLTGQRTGRNGAGNDLDMAWSVASKPPPDPATARRIIREHAAWTRRELARPQTWQAVGAVARALLERGCLSGDELRDVIADALLPPQ